MLENGQLRLEHIKKNGKETLTMTIRGINNLIASIGTWWTNLQAARKSAVIPPSQLVQLPEGRSLIVLP